MKSRNVALLFSLAARRFAASCVGLMALSRPALDGCLPSTGASKYDANDPNAAADTWIAGTTCHPIRGNHVARTGVVVNMAASVQPYSRVYDHI